MKLDMELLEQIVRQAGEMLRNASVSDDGIISKTGDANLLRFTMSEFRSFSLTDCAK